MEAQSEAVHEGGAEACGCVGVVLANKGEAMSLIRRYWWTLALIALIALCLIIASKAAQGAIKPSPARVVEITVRYAVERDKRFTAVPVW